jgi:hypothetical protein
MKKKNLLDIEAEDRELLDLAPDEITSNTEIPGDTKGHPLLVPKSVWQNTVVNFDPKIYPKKRQYKRVECKGDVAFFNKNDMIVAIGQMRKLSRKGGCFEIYFIDGTLEDVNHLEFYNLPDFVLNQVQVDIRAGFLHGSKTLVGIEFTSLTKAFQEKLDKFIAARRQALGFEELEDI